MVGSKTRLIRSATVPPVSEKTANWSGSVVSLSNHQPGMERDVDQRPERQRRRDREPVVDVAQPGAGDRRIDGEDERAEPRRASTANEVEGGLTVVPQVELEPSIRVRGRGRHVLGRRRPERRQRVRDAHATRDAGDRRLAIRVHQAREPGRGEDQGQGGGPAEDRRGGVDLRYVLEHPGDELDPPERVPRSAQAGLGLRSSVDVVEHGSRDMAPGHGPEVPDRRGRGEAAFDGREPDRTRAQIRPELGPAGDTSARHGVEDTVAGRRPGS